MKNSLVTLGTFLFFTATLLAYDLATPEENDAHVSQKLSYSADKDCESPVNTEVYSDSVAITDFSNYSYDSDDEYSSGTETDSSEYESEEDSYGYGLPQNPPSTLHIKF